MLFLSLPTLLFGIVICVSGQQPNFMGRDPLSVVQLVASKMTESQQLMRELGDTNLPEYAKSLLVANEKSIKYFTNNASQCGYSMLQLGLDIKNKKQYSLKMLDAWGKLPSGVELGNSNWMGRYYECLDAQSQNFSGKYCSLGVGVAVNPVTQAKMSQLTIGMCLPNTCSEAQMSKFFLTIVPQLSPVVACPIQPTNYTAADIASLVVCALICVLLLTGTGYELYEMYYIDQKQYHEILNDEHNSVQSPHEKEKSKATEVLQSFSIIKNTKSILNLSQKEGNINALHGMRFISITWVVLGHVFIYTSLFYDNFIDVAQDLIRDGSLQAIMNAYFSVDTFFFLSGLLVVYLGMRQMEKRNGKVQVFWAYLYRYLRLTPAYALCILLFSSIYSKLGDGPLWPSMFEFAREPCSKYWWTNLLYVNNLHPSTLIAECFPHTWYLANDMQFFLLSPFILMLLYKKPKIGKFVLAAGVFFSMVITLALSWYYKEQPNPVGIGILLKEIIKATTIGGDTPSPANATTPAPPIPANQTETDKFWSDLYAKPWCRIGVYLIGMATGYYLHKIKLRVRMNKIFALVMWGIATITALTLVYGLWPQVKGSEISLLSVGTAAFYNAVSRPLWAVCLAWVVIACVSGYGGLCWRLFICYTWYRNSRYLGPINSFLSWKLFIPLSRLTYCAYLIHPVVISWFATTVETRLHYSLGALAIDFLGILVISYGLAFVLSVTVEMPMIGIMKLLFPNKKPEQTNTGQFTNHVQQANA